MYGLLLESLATYIKINWGEGKWEAIRRRAGIDKPSFSVHQVYAEDMIPKLVTSAVEELGIKENEFFEAMGVAFICFVSQYGYDQIMSVLGRHMRDFLNGLDNLHEYLKFSYPKMRAPSFFCENETETGLTLHYRSKRSGFVYYTMGQIKQISKRFYNTDCEIEVLSEKLDPDTGHTHVIFQLTFDNHAFTETKRRMTLIRKEEQLPVRASMIFELFPFCLIFCRNMVIRHTGHALRTLLEDLYGRSVTDVFSLARPLIEFNFTSILERRNNVFELITLCHVLSDDGSCSTVDEEDAKKHLRLRGQMMYMEDWQLMLYLCTPVIDDLNALASSGLYINDFSLHDCSRELILVGLQQSVELKLALDQEQRKSRKLEESMRKLDEEMKRTDELLYQMIPKQVADRIRRGENPVETCQVFEKVSILFADIVSFTQICSLITPMQVVSMLNHMYSLFDQLTEKNGVYKVETVGDAYLVVAGAPVKEINHAELIGSMGLDMLDASKAIKDPSKTDEKIKLRIGVHSGAVVAGVVGLKMPRYCLFGDVVNTASRMESTSESGRIQLSQCTKDLLPANYITEYRGEIQMKGKGKMRTYWLVGREGRKSLLYEDFSWTEPKCFSPKRDQSVDFAFDSEGEQNFDELSTSLPSTSGHHQFSRATTSSLKYKDKGAACSRPEDGQKCGFVNKCCRPRRRSSWGSSSGPGSSGPKNILKTNLSRNPPPTPSSTCPFSSQLPERDQPQQKSYDKDNTILGFGFGCPFAQSSLITEQDELDQEQDQNPTTISNRIASYFKNLSIQETDILDNSKFTPSNTISSSNKSLAKVDHESSKSSE